MPEHTNTKSAKRCLNPVLARIGTVGAVLVALLAIANGWFDFREHVSGHPGSPTPQISVRLRTGPDLGRLQKTSQPNQCRAKRFVVVTINNTASRHLAVTEVGLVTPPHGQMTGTRTLSISSGPLETEKGAKARFEFPHTLRSGDSLIFRYAATSTAAIRRGDFIRVETSVLAPKEVPVPFSLFEPVRCRQNHNGRLIWF